MKERMTRKNHKGKNDNGKNDQYHGRGLVPILFFVGGAVEF